MLVTANEHETSTFDVFGNLEVLKNKSAKSTAVLLDIESFEIKERKEERK